MSTFSERLLHGANRELEEDDGKSGAACEEGEEQEGRVGLD